MSESGPLSEQHFEIGEVAILVSVIPEYNSREVTVVSALQLVMVQHIHTGKIVTGHHYRLDVPFLPPDKPYWVPPEELRKKRPPAMPQRQEVGNWSECPWRPELELTT